MVEGFVRKHVKDNWTSPLAVLEHKVCGRVFADSRTSPTVVVVAAAGGFWSVIGSPTEAAVVERVLETMRRDRSWHFAYSHPNAFWSAVLRSGLGKVKEFVRICFTPPAAAPSTPPALPHGYSVLKIDSQKIFDRYVRLWPWTKEVWGSFETFSAAGGIGVIAIAPNRRIAGGCVSAYVGGGTVEPDLYVAPSAEGKGLASHLAALLVQAAFQAASQRAGMDAVASAAGDAHPQDKLRPPPVSFIASDFGSRADYAAAVAGDAADELLSAGTVSPNGAVTVAGGGHPLTPAPWTQAKPGNPSFTFDVVNGSGGLEQIDDGDEEDEDVGATPAPWFAPAPAPATALSETTATAMDGNPLTPAPWTHALLTTTPSFDFDGSRLEQIDDAEEGEEDALLAAPATIPSGTAATRETGHPLTPAPWTHVPQGKPSFGFGGDTALELIVDEDEEGERDSDCTSRSSRPAAGKPPVTWTCDEDNPASRRVAAKLGFVEAGRTVLFGQPDDA